MFLVLFLVTFYIFISVFLNIYIYFTVIDFTKFVNNCSPSNKHSKPGFFFFSQTQSQYLSEKSELDTHSLKSCRPTLYLCFDLIPGVLIMIVDYDDIKEFLQ